MTNSSNIENQDISSKESSFQRCIHDRNNPYVMISREMAQDRSISPKAKGVLLYLLSLPPNWKIYHSQLQDGLGVGETYINSAMDELIEAGYAERTRSRIDGRYQSYEYIIREFKKCLPNGKSQTGFSGPVNPGLQNRERKSREKEDISKKTTTTERPKKDVVVVFYECLKEYPTLTHEAKIEICETCTELEVLNHIEQIKKLKTQKNPSGLLLDAVRKQYKYTQESKTNVMLAKEYNEVLRIYRPDVSKENDKKILEGGILVVLGNNIIQYSLNEKTNLKESLIELYKNSIWLLKNKHEMV